MRDLTEIYNNLSCLNEDDTENTNSDVLVYMNTWGNYNVNGGDATDIGGGWLTPEKALEWTSEKLEQNEEPFINDVDDNIGLPFEINEYSNVEGTLNDIISYCDLDETGRNTIGAILEADSSLSFEEAKDKYDDGDFIFYENVNNDEELGEAAVQACGTILDTVGIDKVSSYIDESRMYDTWENDLRSEYAESLGIDEDEIDEESFEEYANETISESIETAVADRDESFFDNWFDYDAYGRDLSFDYTYTKYGAINLL